MPQHIIPSFHGTCFGPAVMTAACSLPATDDRQPTPDDFLISAFSGQQGYKGAALGEIRESQRSTKGLRPRPCAMLISAMPVAHYA